jgi:gliding motility-associated-like protein
MKRENGSNRISPLTNVFGNIDSVFVDSLSFNEGQNSFCYSLIAFDFCGNIGDTSNQGCSINLEVTIDPDQAVVQNVLTWNAYSEFKAGTERYEILRSSDSGLTWSNLAALPAGPAILSYSDNQLPDSSGAACYVIVAFENTGGFDATSRSDKVCVIQPARIQIPNVFTANDDNLNDTFGPIGTFFTAYNTRIYDRWGNEVFRSTPDRLRWDGRHQNGGPLAEGNYTYVIEVTDLNGKAILREGRVTLLK